MNKENNVNSIIDKLGSYQILTNLFPGTFFGVGLSFFFNLEFQTKSIVEDLIIYYFMGVIINRIGSLFVEPILKKIHFLRLSSYSDFIFACKNDIKIDTLSEINNYMRSLLTSTLMLLLIGGVQKKICESIWFLDNWRLLLLIFISIIFMLSYRKQTSYIHKRVEAFRNQE